MKLTILGSGTSVPQTRRGSPGYLVEAGRSRLLFDSGPGALRMLRAAGFKPDDIDFAFYSHVHLDHTADLMPLLFVSVNPFAPRKGALTIGGSKEFLDFFRSHEAIHPRLVSPELFELHLVDVSARSVQHEGWSLKTARMRHIPSSVAFRIEETGGRCLVYSGDTEYCDELVSLAGGADLLLAECSFPDTLRREGHLTPELAGLVGAGAGVKKIVLTHFYPECDGADVVEACRKTFRGEIIQAEDLMQVEL
jgi:ribonuclease BN (tRNA processing enzyme)